MKKTEIKKTTSNELIVEYVQTYSSLLLKYNSNRSVVQLEKHCKDLENELMERNILTKEDIDKLNI